MFKAWIATFCLIISLVITGCAGTGIGSMRSYTGTNGYHFLYPNGWVPVDVRGASPGVEVVYRDIVERTENLSVIVSEVPSGKTLTDLGTPTEVGYRFLQLVNQDNSRQTEFLNAESRQNNDQTYYILEYKVNLPAGQQRHNIASVAVDRNKLYTFNISAPEHRWEQVQNSFEVAAKSFALD